MPCCDRCRRPFPDGALRFRVRLLIYGDTGDSLPDVAEPPCSHDALTKAVEEASRLSERELREGVMEELSFVLCPGCRGDLRADPAGAASMPAPRGRATRPVQ